MKFSIIIPTWCRTEKLRQTLRRIQRLEPVADEVLIHIDAGDQHTAEMLKNEFPDVRYLQSKSIMGPGGGRNKLVQSASNDWLFSLDDDSWPIASDFLRQAAATIIASGAQMIACQILEKEDFQPRDICAICQISNFIGCGCVFHRDAFLLTGGYVPLRYAYGMEENDVALKLLQNGSLIIYASALQVYHDCDRTPHHANPRINAAQITNVVLLTYLRYPVSAWPLGFFQLVNRIRYSIKMGRWHGIIFGILDIPVTCFRYRKHRKVVSLQTLKRYRLLNCKKPSPNNSQS